MARQHWRPTLSPQRKLPNAPARRVYVEGVVASIHATPKGVAFINLGEAWLNGLKGKTVRIHGRVNIYHAKTRNQDHFERSGDGGLRDTGFLNMTGTTAPDPSLRPFDRLRAKPVPDFLYHYTSASGLCGIMQSDIIWASKIQYLNDRTELLLALDICERLLRAEADKQLPWSKKVIQYVIETLKRIESANICVCSFSKKGDQLSQWRGYCPHEGGYSLGIPGKHLIDSFAPEKFILVPCVYDSAAQSGLVQDALDIVLPGLLRIPVLTHNEMQAAAEPIVHDLHLMLMEIAPFIKDRNFSEECEWRAVSGPISISHPKVKLRAQGNLIRPYYELPLNLKKINIEVITGPCRYPKLASESCFMLVHKAGLRSYAISGSVIPFRVV